VSVIDRIDFSSPLFPLGIIQCDPVGGFVMAPCIERNGIGAVKAVVSANLAMSSPGGKVSTFYYPKLLLHCAEHLVGPCQISLDDAIKGESWPKT
jgi:hypothetical protein